MPLPVSPFRRPPGPDWCFCPSSALAFADTAVQACGSLAASSPIPPAHLDLGPHARSQCSLNTTVDGLHTKCVPLLTSPR